VTDDDFNLNALHQFALSVDPSLTITRETAGFLADTKDVAESFGIVLSAILRLEDLVRNDAEYGPRD
jgi:NAD kinase